MDQCALEDREIRLLVSSPYLKELRWLSLCRNKVNRGGAEDIARTKNLRSLVYVDLNDNLFEPNERYSYDSGFVVDAGLPEDGLLLESLYGYLRWLRRPVGNQFHN